MTTRDDFKSYLEEKTISELDKKIKDLALNEFSICPIDQEFYTFELGIKYALDNYDKLKGLCREKRNQYKYKGDKIEGINWDMYKSAKDNPEGVLYYRDSHGNWYDSNLEPIESARITDDN